MTDDKKYIDLFNKQVGSLFFNAVKLTLKNPRLALPLAGMALNQVRSIMRRKRQAAKGTHVPPFLIISVTKKCNLSCAGCYMKAHGRKKEEELSTAEMRRVLRESQELGISLVLVAGGEPFLRRDIIELAAEFRKMTFVVFTNGLLIDDKLVAHLKRKRNIIPVLSIEGFEDETDVRRGGGVYSHLQGVINKIEKAKLFWGISLTANRKNFGTISSDEFISGLSGKTCRLFFFVEYVPIENKTEHLVLADEQKEKMLRILPGLRRKFKGLFIAFPGDEEQYGGCLAAGRGFLHISPGGNIEPCPFAPFSDLNIRDISVADALKSRFLSQVRANHNSLVETSGGCALWTNRGWVKGLLEQGE